jgi:hypothetical protein
VRYLVQDLNKLLATIDDSSGDSVKPNS